MLMTIYWGGINAWLLFELTAHLAKVVVVKPKQNVNAMI